MREGNEWRIDVRREVREVRGKGEDKGRGGSTSTDR